MKRHIALIAAFAAAIFAGAPAFANELDGEEIRRAVTGKRIYLATPLGGEIPLYYRADGRVDGSGEAVGLGRWLKPSDSGRWWVAGSRLCQQWQTWYDGEQMCFRLRETGNGKIAWTRDNGETGLARIGD